MDINLIAANLLSPPVLFFFLGVVAALVKSDLDVPHPIPKFLSLYLLLAIGFKGGVELSAGGLGPAVLPPLIAAVALACVVPLYAFAVLRRRFDRPNAAAVAASYGSVSAVTFVTAAALLDQLQLPYGGHMVAAMALMESPAIMIAILLSRSGGRAASAPGRGSVRELLREAVLNGSILLLLGSLIIGFATGERGAQVLKPFTADLFQGFLCLFLLEMGITSARRIGDLRRHGVFPVAFGIAMPLFNSGVALAVAVALGLGRGDALLLCVLAASASYIAVPAAIRLAIPEANPGLYVTMALAITFPFNVAIGIPLYLGAATALGR